MKLIYFMFNLLAFLLLQGNCTMASNSSLIALGMSTNSIWMWDWSTNVVSYTLGSNTKLSYVIYLKDGRLAGQSNVSTVNIWNVASGGKVDLTLNCTAYALEEMYNGWLATGGTDSTLKVWDISANGTLLKNISTLANLYFIRQLTTCNFLATGDSQGNIFIYNPANNFSVYNSFAAHTAGVYMIEELPNGNIISCSNDKAVKIYNFTTGICLSNISPLNAVVYAVKLISPDTVVIGGPKKYIYVYTISANQLISNTTLSLPGNAAGVLDIKITNTDLMMFSLNDGTLAIYNKTNMTLIKSYTITTVNGDAVSYFAVPNQYSINVTQSTPFSCPSLPTSAASSSTVAASSSTVAATLTAASTSSIAAQNIPTINQVSSTLTTTSPVTVNNNLSNLNDWRSFQSIKDFTMDQSTALGSSFYTVNRLRCLLACATNTLCKAVTYDNRQNCTSYFAFPPSNGRPLIASVGTNIFFKV